MILEVKGLKKYFPRERGIFSASGSQVKALDGISFSLEENKILGIVGESGCGKTTLAKLILKLMPPTSGQIIYGEAIRDLRKNVGIVFQDPLLSLDPCMRIKDILREPLIIHRLKKDAQRVREVLDLVRLDDSVLNRYPAALSGGQRQRICIARALMLGPKLLILDEPLSSLDLIIQAQMLGLLLELKEALGVSYIFISHNIAVIKKIATHVIVMLSGKIVEQNTAGEIFLNPKSDYTKKLLEAAL